MKTPIYLDYNATTPIDRRVADVMLPYLYNNFGNPSSSHHYGVQAKLSLEHARQQVAKMIGANQSEIVFTSGGTEANNLAIRGYCLANQDKGNHIITSAVEHPAVLDVCESLKREGFDLTILPVDSDGMVKPHDLKEAIQTNTILVSIMHANNEVGTIQPISELSAISHEGGAVFHCDAAQSIGKIKVDVRELGVDLLSIAGHKFYAPKGIGALFIGNNIKMQKITFGAGHERNLRPGTENILEIAGLGAAAEIVSRDLLILRQHLFAMRNRLEAGLSADFGSDVLRVNGHPQFRLPNTLSVSLHRVQANVFLSKIQNEIAASAGAACHADLVKISHVLKAMKVPQDWAMGTIRFSVGRKTTEDEIDIAIEVIRTAMKDLKI